ncbi:MAG: Na-K-Cl cotransporter, partial [Gramella sp.]|nr:Na-K-Cl cotransporter [Christiangramia sp.]
MKKLFKKQNGEEAPVIPSVKSGLGTFGGVFTPSILTILGVIMYLRFGWVVGNVGLLGTLLIVTLSVSITFLTALSVASIATDQQVRAGGAYYMISRSLGVEAGGAIGIPLFIALTLSIALYTV